MNTITEDRNRKHLALWLFVCSALIFAMVVLGGVTRLTRSGLSMVEWSPIMGIVPPIGESQWLATFEKYKAFPEYQKTNKGMDLDGFKSIFYLEYFHRVLGRLIGLAFLVPFLVFLFRKKIPMELTSRLVIMFFLGGLQGLLGWYMVKSGLVDKPHVSQYRLTAHLSTALLIYGFILWVGCSLFFTQTRGTITPALQRFSLGVTAVISIMILSGGFVAGTKAGFVFNTFPKMNGNWIPEGYLAMQPWLINFFENVATIQFNHRLLALILFLLIPAFWFYSRKTDLPPLTRTLILLLSGMLVIQVGLGIATLVYVVPVALGALHQAGALVLFSLALMINQRLFLS
ncbi:MAG: COX15/CtaA family protein [Gammaproteobacteria bacterium]|nr:MAG: COX15/CtaA family protein [Gammaproteobacteria bacterium]